MPRHKNGWTQGTYTVINYKKYLGTKKPVYRSSYELRLMTYCDQNENVLRWGSEIISIPYYFPLSGKTHKYFTDMYMEVKTKEGKIIKYVVEIKPSSQNVLSEKYVAPKPPKKKTQKAWANYQSKLIDAERNKAKWAAAMEFCKKRGFIFKIVTENDLF